MDAHPPSASQGISPENSDRLGKLLEHPAIWRGRSVAQVDVWSTGFASLDQALPGRGWPRAGLIEILISRVGVGEMNLLLPVLSMLTRRVSARWCAWIAPPFEPFAPALAAHGIALERLFIARGDSPLWAFEQALVSGACEVVLGWAGRKPTAPSRSRKASRVLRTRDIRRLQLAAEKGRTLGVLFRSDQAAKESSSAMLRIVVEPKEMKPREMKPREQGARVTLLKSRGGHRGSIDLTWPSPGLQPSTPPQAHGST